MSPDQRPLTAERVRALISARARATSRQVGVSTQELVALAYRDRFLSRVFTDTEWVLKGGTGMLARVPTARATVDIDLARNGYTIDQSIARLRELASLDLGDFFQFEYRNHESIGAGENQPYVDGVRVVFDVYIGANSAGVIKIDLVAGVGITTPPVTAAPAYRLDVPGLPTTDYRLYSLTDQIADKVCATADTYWDGASSRAKDGVDLVIIARTQHGITATELTRAIHHERRLRRLDEFETLELPATWEGPFARLARDIPACADHLTLHDAQRLITAFVDPALDGSAAGAWDPHTTGWVTEPA
ncbi:nucleotidyl transferase AbiEii/AbiGii toxin family protein [Leifsonia sp. SIMBA_070]|uniref:nucleotidyl transferase AbiEii/AbiGii toxin family protein n=1 Tax=Leifsonia sp. SIMBA_070 TaxID=3085810 RepID=UPI00397B8D81